MSKHFFVGTSLSDPADDPEFYMGNRIIDEPYGVCQGFWMVQSLGSLARIKWEIQEKVLIARLTYERIQNADHHGTQSTNNGQVVAEFNITSHFDIVRDYNPQTGEQLNVIVENTTDRPWYEREYMRVDWSKNLVTDAYDFDLFAVGAAIDGLKYDPLAYYYQDPSDPNAPVFSDADGYLDVTTKVFATPQTVLTPYGQLPLCIAVRDLSGDHVQPGRGHGSPLVQEGRRRRLRAGGLERQQDGRLRLVHGRPLRLRPQLRHRRPEVAPLRREVQHLAEEPRRGHPVRRRRWRDATGNVQNYKVDATRRTPSPTARRAYRFRTRAASHSR